MDKIKFAKDTDRSGNLQVGDEVVGTWEHAPANIRIGRGGSKVHRGEILKGTLNKNVLAQNEHGRARRYRAGETIISETRNLCGAGSRRKGGGQYTNWQGETTDPVDCKYCLKKMSENEGNNNE